MESVEGVSRYRGESVRTLTVRLCELLEGRAHAAVYSPLPFSKNRLLLVLNDESRDIPSVLLEASRRLPRRVSAICLRLSELDELAVPNDHDPATFGMPFWLKNDGRVFYGSDVRPLVPPAQIGGILKRHLQFASHYARNHIVLSGLAAKQYSLLLRRISRERMLLMVTALLARGVWRVYPETLRVHFREVYPDTLLSQNVSQFDELHAQLLQPGCFGSKDMAYRGVWLWESFIRILWNQSTANTMNA